MTAPSPTRLRHVMLAAGIGSFIFFYLVAEFLRKV